MNKSFHCTALSALIFGMVQCSKAKSSDDYGALLLSPPVVVSVTPQIGTPAQNNLNAVYPATTVIIKGSNFGIDSVVRFNEITAAITANLGTEIYTTVPNGAYSGFITVSKSGGSCIAGSNTGVNCAGTEFFVDCYSATNNQYGSEIEIKQGQSKTITFSGTETKAFRTDVIIGSANLTIGCDSIVTIRLFNRTCVTSDYILQKDPKIPLPANLTSQFYMTAGSAKCGITI